MKMLRVLSVAIILACPCCTARADLIVSFTEDGSATTFDVVIGQTVTIPLYIFEDSGSSFLTDRGLLSAGVAVDYDTTAGSATVTSVDLASHWDSAFNLTSFDNSAGVASMSGSVDFTTPFVFPTFGQTSILLGTINFQGDAVGNVTSLSTRDFADQFADVVDGSGISHDADVFATSTTSSITTNAVPEPNSLALFSMASLALLGLWARRRFSSRPLD